MHSWSKKTTGLLGAGAAAVAVLGASGYAYAGDGFGSGAIHGCIGKDRALRITATCRSGEQRIAWQEVGRAGARGPAGAQGATGPAGSRGWRGRPGTVGPAGAPGVDGATGADGAHGVPGAQGEPGAPGAPGAPGEPGAPGAPGEPGAPGAPGADGSASDVTTVTSGPTAVLPYSQTPSEVTASCPQGSRLLSGGYELAASYFSTYGAPQVLASRPVGGVSWRVRVLPGYVSDLTLTVYAVCEGPPATTVVPAA